MSNVTPHEEGKNVRYSYNLPAVIPKSAPPPPPRPPRNRVTSPQGTPRPKKTVVAQQQRSWKSTVVTVLVTTAVVLAGMGIIGVISSLNDSDPTPPTASIVGSLGSGPGPDAKGMCPEGLPQIKLREDLEWAKVEYQAIPGGTPTAAKFNDGLKEWPQFLGYRASNPALKDIRPEGTVIWERDKGWEPLVNADRTCLSDEGYRVLHEMQETYSMAITNDNGKVPANWFNSGNGPDGPVVNTVSGISEDKRPAVEFLFPNGAKDWSMWHCGNWPAPAPSGFKQVPFKPTGGPPPPPYNPPSDNPECVGDHCNPEPPPPPPPPPPPTCEEIHGPDSPECNPEPPCPPGSPLPNPPCYPSPGKDPDKDPFPNGNAPQGGGHNDTDGPGEIKTPEQMEQPPATSYVPPPPPPPTPEAPSSGGPTAEPTPAPPPPVEPGANGTPGGTGTVTAPDTGEIAVDGGTGGF